MSLGGRWTGDGPWDLPVTVAVVADMGLVNAGQTFDRLHQLSEAEEVDFVLHVGDISCEGRENNKGKWPAPESFGTSLSAVQARRSFLTSTWLRKPGRFFFLSFSA